ncbi:uncharacterized protein LOC144162035 [Haemaphysalis longicornis]
MMTSTLGTLVYRLNLLGHLLETRVSSQHPANGSAYNDRSGRVIAPHPNWEERRGARWRSPHPGLHVFTAHYRHEIGSRSTPVIRVTAMASADILDACSVRARVVYRDYPHSFPAGPVTCQLLSDPAAGASANTAEVRAAILQFATGQPATRVPAAASLQVGDRTDSVVWMAVNVVFSEPPSGRSAVAVCLRANQSRRAIPLTAPYRLQGARQVIAYASAVASNVVVASRAVYAKYLPWYGGLPNGAAEAVLRPLLLRDCALRSSPNVKCLVVLAAGEKLVNYKGGFSFGDENFLTSCSESDVVFVQRRESGVDDNPCETVPDGRSLASAPFRMCVNGTQREAALFRLSEGLLDGAALPHRAVFLPPTIALLPSPARSTV